MPSFRIMRWGNPDLTNKMENVIKSNLTKTKCKQSNILPQSLYIATRFVLAHVRNSVFYYYDNECN